MSDEQSGKGNSQQKGWMERISQLLTGEPQDRDDLMDILREAQENRLLDAEALTMIEGVMQVSEMRVRDVMIPRIQMVVLPRDADVESIYSIVIESAHSRFPVTGEDRSEIVGILMAKDLLAKSQENKSYKVEDIMRSAEFIPESKRLNVLLREFRTNRNHMAIVVDEYGTSAGLVTIEDVLEQIVGEIEDEHDNEEVDYIQKNNNGEYSVRALMPIEDFNKQFSLDWKDDEFDTIGGLLMHKLGHMPKKDEKVVIGNYRFEVLKADKRRVYLLKLKINKVSN